MYENDYLMRLIHDSCRMLAKLTLGKDTPTYELPETSNYTAIDHLYEHLIKLVAIGKINEAEDELYDNIKIGDMYYLEMGLTFYEKCNALSDEALEGCNFTREEIKDGLTELAGLYGVENLELLL